MGGCVGKQNNTNNNNNAPESSKELNKKIVIVGAPDVGKTSLLLRYVDNTFNEEGVDNQDLFEKRKTLNVGKTKLNLIIFDTAGQEKFRTITSSHYERTDGVLLVADLSNPESFNLESWMEEVNRYAQKVPIILVGNKSDLPRKVSLEDAKNTEKMYKSITSYYETSALDGKGVDEVFMALAKEVVGGELNEAESDHDADESNNGKKKKKGKGSEDDEEDDD
eukprot:TRINITY_DN984_c0_g1_i1.p1 TRINITY_DN984_c0_g1~~TRINITY_DN984_c0_g1_i1.p1  ORF type:complete len:222 (+),score=50.91 TRINITY_DN984_c0_g1_i1:60-725(+)